MDGLDATTAAYEVGYESVSQFSREYSRFFGLPPIRDVKALKDSNTAMVDAVCELHKCNNASEYWETY